MLLKDKQDWWHNAANRRPNSAAQRRNGKARHGSAGKESKDENRVQ